MSNSSRDRDDGLNEIAGLWERTSANGHDYIGGNTPQDEEIVLPPNSYVMVFPNDSDNPRAPAFRLLFSPPKDQQDTPAPQRRPANSFLSRRRTPTTQSTPATATKQHPLNNPDEPGPTDGP